ncbi:heavy-metal-associated domain-containing protein [Desulfohalobiaceae bacterium Ax17]|uniref:heavy-metal-associated domain-containing protein n=1 Tax=Desulfovulcanus ferrireducens TaxID=2831190 RepID=UPI00207BAA24|nr:heavy metal-associated domain-containing protein [Desulfovulcanus ferrireducens]MBT8763947.1 heavy-metal-associated domain-containing protein [Desulfovulcanus ferrireducens]
MKVFNIEGMSCSHCVQAVKKAISSVPGVKSVEVNLEKKQVYLETDGEVDLDLIKKAVEEEGYKVVR